MRRLFFVLFLLPPLTGCAGLLQLVRGGVRAPIAKFEGADLENASLDDVTVAASFRVTNPNPIGLALAGVGYVFRVDGHRLFDGRLPNGLALPANGAAELRMPIRVPYAAIPDLATTLETKAEAPYEVRASASVRTPVGDLTIPLRWTGTLPLPRLPRLSLAGASVQGLSFAGGEIVLHLAVDNPNAFALPLTAIEGQMLVGGETLATLSLRPARALAARRVTAVDVPVTLSLVAAGRAGSALARGAATVELRGRASFDGRSIPFRLGAALR